MTSRMMPDIGRMRDDATLIMDTPVAIARHTAASDGRGGRRGTDTTIATVNAFVGAVAVVTHPPSAGGAGTYERPVFFPALTDVRVDDRLTIHGERWRAAEVVAGLDLEVVRKVRAVSI
jgi:hypothetical protein